MLSWVTVRLRTLVVGHFQGAKTELTDMAGFEFVLLATFFTLQGFKSGSSCFLGCCRLGHGQSLDVRQLSPDANTRFIPCQLPDLFCRV